MCTPSRATARTDSGASSGPGPAMRTRPRPRRSPPRSALQSLQECNSVITMPKDTNTPNPASPNPAAAAKLQGWFAGRLPDGWFAGPPAVSHDRDEIVVVGTLPTPDTGAADADTVAAASRARIQGFREDTRTLRMRIADEAEAASAARSPGARAAARRRSSSPP